MCDLLSEANFGEFLDTSSANRTSPFSLRPHHSFSIDTLSRMPTRNDSCVRLVRYTDNTLRMFFQGRRLVVIKPIHIIKLLALPIYMNFMINWLEGRLASFFSGNDDS